MIHVVATVMIKQGCLPQALACYRYLLPLVREMEPGCIEYAPTMDRDLGLDNQDRSPARILVSERWQSEQDFRAHLALPHCIEFRARIRPYLAEEITITVSSSVFELP